MTDERQAETVSQSLLAPLQDDQRETFVLRAQNARSTHFPTSAVYVSTNGRRRKAFLDSLET